MGQLLALANPSAAFQELRIEYEADRNLLSVCFAPKEGPRFSWAILLELRSAMRLLRQNDGVWSHGSTPSQVRYVVLRSMHPRFFSLGGDLRVFRDCISRTDRDGLARYSRTCMDMIFEWATGWAGTMTTIALVQGRALGGGFEAALAAEYIIAEEHSEFGFPEILFGLFPASGAYSLLRRRISCPTAEKLMTSGRIYKARELLEMGLIDVVCPSGSGKIHLNDFIDEHSRHQSARLALQRARNRLAPVSYAELLTSVDDWVTCALRLQSRELQLIDWLIKAQAADAW